VNFSGGQRQRIEIARALIRNPSIVILDEAVDSLEPSLEERILQNLRRRGCTLIVITHRVSTLQRCDEVIRFEQGRIVPDGDRPSSVEKEDSEPLTDSPFHPGSDSAPTKSDEPFAPAEDALREAFKLVSQASGCRPRSAEVPNDGSSETQRSRIACGDAGVVQLARDAGLMSRRVRLVNDNWWQRDNGPMIGFLGDDRHPVALLSRSDGPCLMIDPRDGTRRCLTADVASQIDRQTWCLNSRLSDRVTRLPQLVSASLPLARTDALLAVLCSLFLSVLALTPAVAAVLCFGGEVTVLESRRSSLPERTSSVTRPDGRVLPERVLPGRQDLLRSKVERPGLMLAAVGLTAVSTLLFAIVQTLAEMRCQAKLEYAANAGLWERIYRLPVAYFRTRRAGELSRRTRSASDWCTGAVEAMFQLVRSGTAMLLAIALIVWFSPLTGAVAIGLLVLPLIVTAAQAVRGLPDERKRRELSMKNSAFLFDALRGIARLWSADSERPVINEWIRRWRGEVSLDERLRRRQFLQSLWEDWYPPVAVLTLAWAILASAIEPTVICGVIWAFGVAVSVLPAMTKTIADVVRLRLEREEGERLLQSDFESSEGDRHRAELRGGIEVRGVTFSYDGTRDQRGSADHDSSPDEHNSSRPVLRNLDLHVAPGEFVALAGPSGGGKSTLLRVMLDFERPHAGQVLFDGIPLERWDLSRLRSRIGAVLQEDRLDVCSLRGNLAGSSPYGMDAIWEATRIAALDDDIRRMPMGIQTILQDNMLSSGQKQRLLVAGKVLREPRVLLLDEATSALNEDLQTRIFDNLRSLGITCVFVAHRASTVKFADRVFVIDDGSVVQSGSPLELFNVDGPLSRLHAREREESG
jgi:ABC-type bacteriocin/lantibiotic exporter with double-glycine peptidase domain